MWLVNLVINRPIFLVMFEAFLVVLGILGYSKLGVDEFPEVDPPVITVTTEYPGADPESIETLVTKKLEEEINQIGGINQMTSTTRENISQIVVEFDLDVDARRAKTDVQDKVTRAKAKLPRAIEEPLVQRLDFADKPIIRLALVQKEGAKKESPAFLREYAKDKVKPKLQKINGVGQVNLFGGDEREIVISLDRDKLMLWKETPTSVAAAIRNNNLNIPAGSIKEEPVNRSLRILGEYERVSDINNTIVKNLPGGRVLKVSDLGVVKDDLKEPESFARLNGKDVIFVEVKRQSGTNTVEVSDSILKFLEESAANLPGGFELIKVFDGAKKIKMSVNDVVETLLIAAVLTIIVVYLFLGSGQSTFITGAAFPTTFISSFFVIYLMDYTLNIMTLLGLTLSVGLVLDDAIVVRENIWKKLEKGMSPKGAALNGTKEVFIAVLATSLTILAVFIPVTMIPGIVGRFFAAFASTVCIAIVLSTFDALTMAPMLSAYMVKAKGKESKPNFIIRRTEYLGGIVSRLYEKLLKLSVDHRKKTLIFATLIFVLSISLVKFVGFTFMPASESGEIDVIVESVPGTTLRKANLIAESIENMIKGMPGLDLYATRVGNDLGEVNQSTIYIKLVPYSEREKTTSEVKDYLRKSLARLVKKENLILTVTDSGGPPAGRRKPITLAIQGADVDRLYKISADIIEKSTKSLPNIIDMESNLKPGKGEVRYRLDAKRAAAFGLTTQQVGNTIRGLYRGELAGYYRELGNEYDINVRLNANARQNIISLGDFTIPNSRGEAIPLSAVTKTSLGTSPTKIVRIDQQRSAMIEGDLASGAALGTELSNLAAIVEKSLPEGYSYEFLGQAKNLKDLAVGAVTAIVLGALFIYMIMASLYDSFIIPFSILLTLPLAIVGTIFSFFVLRLNLDVYSVIGIILLMGLVTKNAILLVDYIEQLRLEGVPRHQAIMGAGVRRLRPIMMTAISTVAGMLPIALGYGELNKIRAGMGIAIIGGLLSSTFLSLVVIPCVYIYLDDFRVWSKKLVARVYN